MKNNISKEYLYVPNVNGEKQEFVEVHPDLWWFRNELLKKNITMNTEFSQGWVWPDEEDNLAMGHS